MKTVLVVGMTENPGGIESVIMTIVRAIDKNKFKFVFLTNVREMAYEDEVTAMGMDVIHIYSRSKHFFKFYRQLNAFFRVNGSRFDIIWLNVCSLANISYLSQAKKAGINKRIIHCHNSQNGEGLVRGMLHQINRFRIKYLATDYWSCSNDASLWFYGKKYKSLKNYYFVPNSIKMKEFKFDLNTRNRVRSFLKLNNSDCLIGNVARFSPQKNHGQLIEIFKHLHIINNNYKLLLIGEGELMNDIKEKVLSYNLKDSVIFLGKVRNVSDYYNAMDLFLFPSLFEGFAIAPLEAQANNVPCVLSTGNPKEEFINDNVLEIDIKKTSSVLAKVINEWFESNNNNRFNFPLIFESMYSIDKQIGFIESILES